MPAQHTLTPPLAVPQGKGLKVAQVTEGRVNGAPGKPARIEVEIDAVHAQQAAHGLGREHFSSMRPSVTNAGQGACGWL